MDNKYTASWFNFELLLRYKGQILSRLYIIRRGKMGGLESDYSKEVVRYWVRYWIRYQVIFVKELNRVEERLVVQNTK